MMMKKGTGCAGVAAWNEAWLGGGYGMLMLVGGQGLEVLPAWSGVIAGPSTLSRLL